MWRNPPSLGQAAMISARQPEDVLRRSGSGCGVEILILIVLSILAVWFLLKFNAAGLSPGPSPNPSVTIDAGGSLPPTP